MNDKLRRMLEATRFAHSGQLLEATEILRGLLHGEGKAPEPAISETASKPSGGGPSIGGSDRAASPHITSGPQFIERSYSNPAGSRAYKLYIPSGLHNGARPLIVMLHGCAQTPDDFATGTRMNALAEERGCFVAYPAQSASANPSRCWNWHVPGNQLRGVGEPSLIAGITRQIMRDHPIDAQLVYVAGMSAGAAAAAVMGMTYPDLYTAIGVHSGLAWGAASDLSSAFAAMRGARPGAAGVLSSLANAAEREALSVLAAWSEASSSEAGEAKARRLVPTIVFHGDEDATVHAYNGDLVIAQSRTTTPMDLYTRMEWGQAPGGLAYSRTLHTDAGGQAVLEQWVIHGAGHAWSGGSPTGSFTDPRGPDATREMLRFFFSHAHPEPSGVCE
jgi:poly(hydroxyalkanoate) depolymerase family esterase